MSVDQSDNLLLEPPVRTLLEWARAEDTSALAIPGQPGQILPVVLDTNVVLNDIAYSMRHSVKTSLVHAADVGSFRLFASSHVMDEVEEHLDNYCARRGVDASRARRYWEQAFMPRVWFVQVPEDITDERVGQVRSRDQDDAPTAGLACLLAPCLSFSEDQHLVVEGMAHGQWQVLAVHGRHVALGDSAMVTTLLVVSPFVYGAVQGTKWLIRSGLAPFFAVAGAGAAVYVGRQRRLSWEAVKDRFEAIRPAALELLGGSANALERYKHGRQMLLEAAIAPLDSPLDLRCSIAHVLAVSPGPLSGTMISRALHEGGWRVRPADVNQILRSYEAFNEVRRARWRVGQQYEMVE